MRKSLFALLAFASLSFAACPTWVGQAAAYSVGTVVTLNGQNYQAARTMDNGWISPTDSYFWTAVASTNCSSAGGATNPGKVNATGTTMVVEAMKQGKLKGESQRAGRSDAMDVAFGSSTVSAPRDVATGLASGKIQYGPVTVTKAWGAASPQIALALSTNEVLKKVALSFWGIGADGVERIQNTITLTNANVSSIVRHLDASGNLVEDVSFTFQRIDLVDNLSGNMASDDWTR